jgi:hypothetical protein
MFAQGRVAQRAGGREANHLAGTGNVSLRWKRGYWFKIAKTPEDGVNFRLVKLRIWIFRAILNQMEQRRNGKHLFSAPRQYGKDYPIGSVVADYYEGLVKATIELALATQQYANLATKAPQNFWNEFAAGNTIELEPKTLQTKIPESVQIVPVSDSTLPILARAAHAP